MFINKPLPLIIASCLACGFVSSCANVQEESPSALESSADFQGVEVLNAASCGDSLKVRSVIQSDVDVMLMNHISLTDGVFSLDLSLEDALSLGVDEEKYRHYETIVESLNEKKGL